MCADGRITSTNIYTNVKGDPSRSCTKIVLSDYLAVFLHKLVLHIAYKALRLKSTHSTRFRLKNVRCIREKWSFRLLDRLQCPGLYDGPAHVLVIAFDFGVPAASLTSGGEIPLASKTEAGDFVGFRFQFLTGVASHLILGFAQYSTGGTC